MPIESVPFPTSPSAAAPSDSAATTEREAPRVGESWSDDALHHDAASADEMIGRIAQSAHETIDRLAESAAPHVNRLQESVAGTGDALRVRADRAREMTDEWAESLRCTVRESPLAALGVALAVGMLVARLAR
jgi:ElaB/YqjD/DUF883 family membrane-anchored ribosome-binding protein